MKTPTQISSVTSGAPLSKKMNDCNVYISDFPFACDETLGKSMSIFNSLNERHFSDFLWWPLGRVNEMNVFRQNFADLVWNKTSKQMKNLHVFIRAPAFLYTIGATEQFSTLIGKRCSEKTYALS